MNTYLQYIIAFGVLGLSAGNFFTGFGKGSRGGSGELIEFYKKEAADYKDMSAKKDIKHAEEIKAITADFNGKYHDLTQKFGELQGQYNAEKGMRERAEEILKDKNPETKAFMELVIKSCEDQGKVNEAVTKAMTKMGEILGEIHTMAKAEHDRDIQITSTISKTP